MKLRMFAAATAAVAAMAASSANATVTFSFEGGVGTPSAGFAVINTFDTPDEQALVNCPGGVGNCHFQSNNSDGDGASNPFSNGFGSPFLTVLTGPASISFGPTTAFQFDWGSLDFYNTLVIHGSTADVTVIPGTTFMNAANGDQLVAGTNGRFTVRGTAGETFTGITLTSSQRSFEIDNLAVASVPEPATWAMMIGGFGMAGAMLRRRRTVTA